MTIRTIHQLYSFFFVSKCFASYFLVSARVANYLSSQYLFLILYNVQAYIKMLFTATCYIGYFIVELFIEDTQLLTFCCVRHILLSIP